MGLKDRNGTSDVNKTVVGGNKERVNRSHQHTLTNTYYTATQHFSARVFCPFHATGSKLFFKNYAQPSRVPITNNSVIQSIVNVVVAPIRI